MPRRLLARAVLCLVVLAGGVARAQNKSKAKDKDAVAAGPEMRFLQGLRERGYNDLALEYLDALRKDPSVSPELKVVLDYEEGRGILDEATRLATSTANSSSSTRPARSSTPSPRPTPSTRSPPKR